ncbi:MAG: hypothetical protein LAT50_21655 [Ectothiorhodospiraceae bacterium]|nr:hypothetical protein [Ectothiorhodospiraceae bacterium]
MEAKRMSERSTGNGQEVDRLRRELVSVRKRLEEEVAYHRAQAETARQRAESEHLRAQAAEVARRRKLEDKVATLEAQRQEAAEHAARLQRRYDELSQQFLKQEESARHTVQEEVERYRAAAQSAWRSAEEELSSMERELQRQREMYEREHQRARQLEDTLRDLQGVDGGGAEDQEEALLEEVSALKKALNLSERGRAQSQRRAIRLAEQLVELEARLHADDEPPEAQPAQRQAGAAGLVQETYRAFQFGAGNPREVDLSEANSVLRSASATLLEANDEELSGGGDRAFEGDLADEFLMVSSDQSLDRVKLEKLQQEVERAEREGREHEAAREKRRRANVFLDPDGHVAGKPERKSLPPQAAAVAPAASGGLGRRLLSIVLLMVLLGALTGVGLWLMGVDMRQVLAL